MNKIITIFHTIFTPARIRGLMGPHTGAYRPTYPGSWARHAGPDKIQTIFAKDTKENKMLL